MINEPNDVFSIEDRQCYFVVEEWLDDLNDASFEHLLPEACQNEIHPDILAYFKKIK